MRTDVVLHSALAPAALAEALRRSTDEERRTIFALSGYKGDRPVLGEVQKTRLGCRDGVTGGTNFAHIFMEDFVQNQEGPG
jgi:hypothetical protein